MGVLNFVSFYRAKLEEMKELQNLRKRPHGVSLLGLALGKKASIEEEADAVCIS